MKENDGEKLKNMVSCPMKRGNTNGFSTYGQSSGLSHSLGAAQQKHNLYIQMEYCGQNSLEKINELGPMSGNEILLIFSQLVDALSFLHSKSIAHGQISAKNIFMVGDQLKLANLCVDKLSKIPEEEMMGEEQASERDSNQKIEKDLRDLGQLLEAMID